jgi:hypothetical protein
MVKSSGFLSLNLCSSVSSFLLNWVSLICRSFVSSFFLCSSLFSLLSRCLVCWVSFCFSCLSCWMVWVSLVLMLFRCLIFRMAFVLRPSCLAMASSVWPWFASY